MARVFLVNPPSPEPVRTPLLSFCHLAASLRAAGHEVALLDASAPHAPSSHEAIAEQAARFAPDLVGLHLKTLHVQPAYALAAVLAARSFALVGGGPHATIVPDEPLAHGFRWVIRGEGEDALVELADAIDRADPAKGRSHEVRAPGEVTSARADPAKGRSHEVRAPGEVTSARADPAKGRSHEVRAPGEVTIDGRRALAGIAGLSWIDRGLPRHNPARPFQTELDRLAPPLSALDLFDPAWYGAASVLPPAGILSSRGCPAACTFCSNDVTGRRFRYRSAGSVAAEVALLRDRHGLPGFSFYDDSFAVGRRRVRELCGAIAASGGPVWWSCTAHPAHLDRDVLADMKRAGCAGIDIGMESADPEMLVRIGKGVTVERVLDVLAWCRDEDIHCIVNLMFGWPDETDEELDATISFLDRAAPLAGGFNARGVVVPYPGTEIYERHHERFGFTGWWIREAPLAYPVFPTAWSEGEIVRAYAEDPALDRNFFHHPPHRLARIREALGRKASITMAITRRRASACAQGADTAGVPAAGAR